MRIVELLNNIQIPLTNEEWDVLTKFNESEEIVKSSLDPREQILANQLVNKDVLTRKKNTEGSLAYYKKIR
jgi:hypothetical protein